MINNKAGGNGFLLVLLHRQSAQLARLSCCLFMAMFIRLGKFIKFSEIIIQILLDQTRMFNEFGRVEILELNDENGQS